MFKIFRRARQDLVTDSRYGSYLLYALGEVVLVVIGILIALQINNWNEHRKILRLEEDVLRELLSDLKSDIVSLEEDIKLNERAIASNEHISAMLGEPLPADDTLGAHFGSIQHTTQFGLSSGGYANLKSRGFEIISNAELRASIIQLQDKVYTYLLQIGERNNSFSSDDFLPAYRPYFTNFSYSMEKHVAIFTPSDQAKFDDPHFRNLLAFQKYINEQTLQVLNSTMREIDSLKAAIELELDEPVAG